MLYDTKGENAPTMIRIWTCFSTIALSYPPRVRVRATVKLSAAFFHDESSITIGGVRKCNSALNLRLDILDVLGIFRE